MAKQYGSIGFAFQEETVPGVWTDDIVDRKYYFELTKSHYRWQKSNSVNDNLTMSNELSVLADPFAMKHYSDIIYAEVRGVRWKVTDIDLNQYPRMILQLGDKYNG